MQIFLGSEKNGISNDILNKDQVTKIENKFGNVMKELGYL